MPTRLLVTSRASQDSKSWQEIGAEVLGVVKDVATKVKDTATSAIESITTSKQQNKPVRRQEQRGAPLYRPEDDRQLPQFPAPGGLFGGLMGGLVNQAVKGLAKEMQKTAAETRSVSETAALRIQQSPRIQQRLGPVTVGPAMSQSMSTSSINGRVSKTISLIMPLMGAGGLPVAQAQVTQVEAAGQVDSCRIAVRMPEGDTVVLDDEEPFSSGGGSVSGQQFGEVVDAEFRDIK